MYPDNTFHLRISILKIPRILVFSYCSVYSENHLGPVNSLNILALSFSEKWKHRGTTLSRKFLEAVIIENAETLVDGYYWLSQLTCPVWCYGNCSNIWNYSNSIYPKKLISMIQNLRIQQHWGLVSNFPVYLLWYLWSLKQHIFFA